MTTPDELHDIISKSITIESRLKELGGTGRGLFELAKSIKWKMDPVTYKRIKNMSWERNQAAHSGQCNYHRFIENYCAVDATVLRNPFIMAGKSAANIAQLLGLCREHRKDAEWQLGESNIEKWLIYMGDESAAKAARLAVETSGGDRSLALSIFLGEQQVSGLQAGPPQAAANEKGCATTLVSIIACIWFIIGISSCASS